mmetsp:Transcript_20854/g.62756  ORF Transcript_20854/g.62756 Transcript_20854/m.62756 type:complete len:1085 (+) Transcript_20854:1468-4722(+)
MRQRDVMSLIKQSAPLLSMEAYEEDDRPLAAAIEAAGREESCVWHRAYGLGSKAELLVAVRQPEGPDGPTTVQLTSDLATSAVLHWGVRRGTSRGEWLRPPDEVMPKGTDAPDGAEAVDTAFQTCTDTDCELPDFENVELQRLTLNFPAGAGLSGLIFVLRSEDNSAWWKDGGGNFTIPIPSSKEEEAATGELSELSRVIADFEKSDQMTLMHRFNKACDLLDQVQQGQMVGEGGLAEAMATIFVWLRYSSSRQLTWQRNYNTQPRILGEAQNRLTHAIAKAHANTDGVAQEWVRLMLSCVGRGGNAQQIRDEILNIMHRNHIPEKNGTWMEQWHQKLHNNTTPDDIGICEAYLAFLRGNGDNGAYWKVLDSHGITRDRMESFDRKITEEPQYFGDKKDALIHDFQNYLGIIKAVHEGADLQASASAAKDVSGAAKGYLGYVLSHAQDSQILPLIENAVECRTELAPCLSGNREMLYLDLALENVARGAAERGAGKATGAAAGPLVGPLLQNLALSTGDNEEVVYCLAEWLALPQSVLAGTRPSKEDALKAAAVVDRIRRALSHVSDNLSSVVEPISTGLGKAFGVAGWAVELFAEEVIRGGPAFALSLVLGPLEKGLRAAAELGAWQLISPRDAVGRVLVVDGLHEIQDEVYEEPTVILAQRVTGEEEVPEGAVAVLTPDAPDVLSHVSVRARNMKVLFAICHDPDELAKVAEYKDKTLSFKVTAAGGVEWEEGDSAAASSGDHSEKAPKRKIEVEVPKWCGKWVVGMDAYAEGVVGAKSKNIAGLRGKLPDSIALPASVTVPFGSFEEALKDKANKDVAKRLEEAVKAIPSTAAEPKLAECREIVMEVTVPEKLQTQLKAEMEMAGIPLPSSDQRWEQALTALKGVWASMYNERAMLSMRKVGIDFRDIRMAVLVQRIVPAAYAFVIHTVNPTNGDEGEIYADLVAGLGESIVSGMVPGTSLSFTARKDALDDPKVVTYPSKSEGMFVPESLIFRSDSNGEDLAGYAGAGLYDSITLETSTLKKVQYNTDRIMTDEAFQRQVLSTVVKAGAAIEKALGSAQDIEGVIDSEGNLTVVQTRPQM